MIDPKETTKPICTCGHTSTDHAFDPELGHQLCIGNETECMCAAFTPKETTKPSAEALRAASRHHGARTTHDFVIEMAKTLDAFAAEAIAKEHARIADAGVFLNRIVNTACNGPDCPGCNAGRAMACLGIERSKP